MTTLMTPAAAGELREVRGICLKRPERGASLCFDLFLDNVALARGLFHDDLSFRLREAPRQLRRKKPADRMGHSLKGEVIVGEFVVVRLDVGDADDDDIRSGVEDLSACGELFFRVGAEVSRCRRRDAPFDDANALTNEGNPPFRCEREHL